jgi:hypothetical protein
MESLQSVMLRGYFDTDLWKMFAELNYFYSHLCAKQVLKTMMQKFEKEILILVCKILIERLLRGSHSSHVSTMMPFGGSPRGGEPPTWPPPWGPTSGGPSMLWGPPLVAGYWPLLP